tara:strand:- start:87 stop:398 length:312 start_codon:yes stop_codon:yes gene_type:complete
MKVMLMLIVTLVVNPVASVVNPARVQANADGAPAKHPVANPVRDPANADVPADARAKHPVANLARVQASADVLADALAKPPAENLAKAPVNVAEDVPVNNFSK